MTPKDQAEKLIAEYYNLLYSGGAGKSRRRAIKCSIIVSQEMLKELPMYTGGTNPRWMFWTEVKKELETLNK